MGAWRYYLQSLPSGKWIDKDLPLVGGEVVTAINAPASIRGTIPAEYAQLRNDDGTLAIREWGCLIVAEELGRDPIVAIVDRVPAEGQALSIEAGGFSMYPTGLPWLGKEFAGIDVDPMNMVRKIFAHVQSYAEVGLDIAVDSTTSPVRIGTEEKDVEFTTGDGETVEFESGPFRLAEWATEDLGKTFSELAEQTPFQYMERSEWDGENLKHRLQLGYPTLGARRHNLRFEVGVNITAAPAIIADEYASTVVVFGAGQGRKKVSSGPISAPTDRMRRVHVETDKSITSTKAAKTAARAILKTLIGSDTIDTVEVSEHDSAPFGTFGPGDEIYVQGDAGWSDLDLWVRIEEMAVDTDTGKMSLKVVAV